LSEVSCRLRRIRCAGDRSIILDIRGRHVEAETADRLARREAVIGDEVFYHGAAFF
jgi:hypothetical protein